MYIYIYILAYTADFGAFDVGLYSLNDAYSFFASRVFLVITGGETLVRTPCKIKRFESGYHILLWGSAIMPGSSPITALTYPNP